MSSRKWWSSAWEKNVGNWTFELGLTQTHNGGHYWLILPEATVAWLYWLHYPNHVYKNSDILDYSIVHRCMGDLTIIKNPHYNVAVRCYWPWRKTHSHYHQRLQVFFLKHNFIKSAKIWINSIFTSVSYILSHVKSGFRNYSVALDCCVREMGIWIMLLPYGLVLTIYPIYSEIHLVYIKIQ